MKRPRAGRSLFYSRDSGGKAELAPSGYVDWANRTASELGLTFNGTTAMIDALIREGRHREHDLFFDFCVQGNVLKRPGLDALIQEAERDQTVSHLLIPRRDRLARPQYPVEAMKLEHDLRAMGLNVVYMNKTLAPISKGQRGDLAELIMGMVEFESAGAERRTLAEKILAAQLRLAKMGYSTGGRAPFGFRRWLVREDGGRVRQLEDGERVRKAAHHVVWLPGPQSELDLVFRILQMLKTMPASHVAAKLNTEMIPSPDAGRTRTDNGVRHTVSGLWNVSTINNIARNKLLVGIAEYGRRSMGDQLRYSPAGPRAMQEASDYRPDEKPKTIQNPLSIRTIAPAHHESLVEPEEHRQLMEILDQRGSSQRGKPRSRDPRTNPLGGRIYDMACTWPLYREPYNDTFRYRCALYQQSHGARCECNHVDGMTATKFVLSCIQQRLLAPELSVELEKRFRQFAEQESRQTSSQTQLLEQRSALTRIEADLAVVQKNLARASTDAQYQAISAEFDTLKRQQTEAVAKLKSVETAPKRYDIDSEVRSALALVKNLTELANEANTISLVGDLFRQLNARLFLAFQSTPLRTRVVQRVASGVVTFGAAPAPVEIYSGRTDREAVKIQSSATAACNAAGPESGDGRHPDINSSGGKGKSIGNVNRGDWIRTSDLLVPNQAL